MSISDLAEIWQKFSKEAEQSKRYRILKFAQFERGILMATNFLKEETVV